MRRVALLLFALTTASLIAAIASPLLLPAGALPDYQADPHAPALEESPAIAMVYRLGSLVCHQMPERSFAANGNQMALCHRCTGVFLGMAALFLLAVMRKPGGGFFQYLWGLFFDREAPAWMIYLAILGGGMVLGLPMVVDGYLQLFTSYESTMPVRLITGFCYGVMQGGLALGLIAEIDVRIDAWADRGRAVDSTADMEPEKGKN
jgi:uncharacterized membrane protein